MDIYDILFILEPLVPLFIVGLVLIWMFHDVPKEDRPWAILKRHITGNLNKEEMEAKKERSDQIAELTMLASRFAFTNVPRHLLRLAIVILVGGLVYGFVILLPMDTSDWKPVDATISDTGITDTWCEENYYGGCHYNGHFPTITFTWQIDGVTYESERYTFFPVNLSSDAKVVEWLEPFSEGSAATAFYNPDDPSDAVLITHDLLEAYGYTGNWIGTICLSIFCLPIPLMLWITVLRFERALPEHRGKRFKLSINKPSEDSFWNIPEEALQLQKQARNQYLKQNYEKFGDSFQEAMEMTEQLDAETEEISGELGNFHIIADGVEKEIKVKSVGELFRKIGYIFEDSGTLFLEDSKQDGRRLDFEFRDEDFIVRELNGEDLVLEETLGEEGGYGRVLEILKNALAKTTEEDEEWWS
ncbi:TPA: DUF3592 domain-containing protein [Candidatus Thalassarchaeaceae archaeon]|nr:MAG TPA: DUF3592 domain-containing protein [Candidatus Poseidoniales archaeon]HII43144.1 DUF3592 domain-containing protein [Candidatus Thalassarchaeaceae archaeon]|tara:strand:+ start:644 stop:1891 length:1248 start_codon:yes stop_codon:yes gene_type:complete